MLCDRLVRVHPRWKVVLWLMAIFAAVSLSSCDPIGVYDPQERNWYLCFDGSVLVLSIYAAWQPANFATTVELQSGDLVVAGGRLTPGGAFHFIEVPGNYRLNVTSGLQTACSRGCGDSERNDFPCRSAVQDLNAMSRPDGPGSIDMPVILNAFQSPSHRRALRGKEHRIDWSQVH